MANFYRKPFIYIPKKKNVIQSGGSSIPPVGVPSKAFKLYGDSSTEMTTFWVTPETAPNTGLPDLILDGKTIFFNTSWAATGVRVTMLITDAKLTNVNFGKITFQANGDGVQSIPSFHYAYLYTNASGTVHMYKLDLSSLTNWYIQMANDSRMVSVGTGVNVSLAYHYFPSTDVTKFGNLRDSAAVQGALPSPGWARFLFLSDPLTDAEVINLTQDYALSGVTTIENLII